MTHNGKNYDNDNSTIMIDSFEYFFEVDQVAFMLFNRS